MAEGSILNHIHVDCLLTGCFDPSVFHSGVWQLFGLSSFFHQKDVVITRRIIIVLIKNWHLNFKWIIRFFWSLCLSVYSFIKHITGMFQHKAQVIEMVIVIVGKGEDNVGLTMCSLHSSICYQQHF